MPSTNKSRTTALSSIRTDPRTQQPIILDQSKLPFSIEERAICSVEDAATAIRSMQVRGAPLIGVAAAYGVALAMDSDNSDTSLSSAIALLAKTRPTAVNLAWALKVMHDVLSPLLPSERRKAAWATCNKMAAEDVSTNLRIGQHGLELLKELHRQLARPLNILTHCNAGSLACVAYGTALAPIYLAAEEKFPVHVYVDETRPRNQGLLTALELGRAGISHSYIVDNAGGRLMQQGKIDLVIVGADRVARNGDAANKIGTYLKALAAKDCAVPFYVALPSSTIDWSLPNGSLIEIEERSGDEVRFVRGVNCQGVASEVRLLAETSQVENPAFDVTPARLITGIITELGVVAPAGLAAQFGQ